MHIHCEEFAKKYKISDITEKYGSLPSRMWELSMSCFLIGS